MMEIEVLKRKIDRIAARRMILESKEHFERRPANPVWSERLCDWCGKEFNQAGAELKHYCCAECKRFADAASKNRRDAAKNRLGDQRAHRGPKDRADDSEWLARIKRHFGRLTFNSVALAKEFRADSRRVRELLKRLADLGRVECLGARGGVYEWRVKG